MDKSARKSPPRLADGRVAPGRGPRPGAPNAGRPPSAVRAAMREALAERVRILEAIADDEGAAPGERIRALEVLARYGVGTSDEVSATVADVRLTEAERRARLESLLARARGGGAD